ncbi:MAG: signal peptidase I [Clostridiales bacterium]|nr:signal peptidase I [Clostridiales bacterium]
MITTREIKKKKSRYFAILLPAVVLVVLVCLIRVSFDRAIFEGEAMLPTFEHGDTLINNKTAYITQKPHRFDIIMMEVPEQSRYIVRRIIGLPNEHIHIANGLVSINREILDEEYLYDAYTDGNINVLIPDGFYFVMGDNRLVVDDSRTPNIGLVAKKSIRGKIIYSLHL